jgi:hypothetical protein
MQLIRVKSFQLKKDTDNVNQIKSK